MGSKSTQTQSTTIKGIGSQEQGARDVLQKLSEALPQLGDLTDLANGKVQLDPKDMQLLQQIQELSGQAGRNQLQQNFDAASGAVEGDLLSKGLEGSSIEAVQKAILGRQLQQSLDQSAIQGQIQTAQGARQHALDKAGLKLNANQVILQRILGGAQGLAGMGLQERLAQQTTTQESKQGFGAAQALALGTRAAEAFASGGTSEVARAGMSAAGQLSDNYANPQNYTTDRYGD